MGLTLRSSSTTILKALLAYAACHAVFYSLTSSRSSSKLDSHSNRNSKYDPTHLVPHWAPGTNLSIYVYLDGSPNADVFAKTRMAPMLEARRKRKAEMKKNGYIGHGAYRKVLQKTDPDYEEQMTVMRKMRYKERQRQARLKREAEERAAKEAAGELEPTSAKDPLQEALLKAKKKSPGGVAQFLMAPGKPAPEWPLSFVFRDVIYGDMDDEREIDLDVGLPFSAQRNSPVYADIFVTVNGSHPDPAEPSYVKENVVHSRTMLTQYFRRNDYEREKRRFRRDRRKDNPFLSTIGYQTWDQTAEHHSHWPTELALTLVSSNLDLEYKKLGPELRQHVNVLPRVQLRDPVAEYYPIVYPLHFWKVRADMIPLSTRVENVPLHVTFSPTTFLNFQTYSRLDQIDKYLQDNPTIITTLWNDLKRWIVHTPLVLVGTACLGVAYLAQWSPALAPAVHEIPVTDGWLSVSPLLSFAGQVVVLLYLLSCKTHSILLLWQLGACALSAFNTVRQPWSKPVVVIDKQKLPNYATWISDAEVPAALCLASVMVFRESTGVTNAIISALASYVYTAVLLSSVVQVIASSKALVALSRTAVCLMAANTLLYNSIAFLFNAPFLYQFAAIGADIVLSLAVARWLLYKPDAAPTTQEAVKATPKTEST